MNKDIKRPRGHFPSLPSAVDLLIKKHSDDYRSRGQLIPELAATTWGGLFRPFNDLDKLNRWRNWQTGLRAKESSTGIELIGAIDECWVDYSGKLVPVDYKTSGFGNKDKHRAAYARQLSFYSLLLELNDFLVAHDGFLVYLIPQSIDNCAGNCFNLHLRVEMERLTLKREGCLELVKSAAECLRGDLPDENDDCEYCEYAGDYGGIVYSSEPDAHKP